MRWWEIARAQAGVASREQLAATGLSASTIARMARRGELQRMSNGVFLTGGAPQTFQARLWAAHLATGGVLALTTAGLLWGVHDGKDPQVHVVIAPRRRVQAPTGVQVHRRTLPAHAIRLRSELPVTERRWTVLDLLAHLPESEATRLADRAVQRSWLAPRDVAQRLRDRPRHPGNSQLRAVAALMGDGAAAESERVLHRLLRRAGITDWIPNQEVWAGGELIGVIDVAIPGRGLAIEVDGMAYHTDVDRFRRDRAKQNALVALGWTVLRFTWADLIERPGYVIATIQRLAA